MLPPRMYQKHHPVRNGMELKSEVCGQLAVAKPPILMSISFFRKTNLLLRLQP